MLRERSGRARTVVHSAALWTLHRVHPATVPGRANVLRVVGAAGVTVSAAVAWVDREVTREEWWLAQRFGEEFAAYRAAVPRYLPRMRVWKMRRRPLGSVG